MGLYQSGFTLSVRYAGIVFTALGMEYYPRISAACRGGMRGVTVMMRHQAGITLLIVAPLAALMVVLAPWIVRLLYSAEFEEVVPFVRLAAPGLVLRGVSWCMAFVLIAGGRGRLYLFTELTSCAVCLCLTSIAYTLGGIRAVGVSFTLWYLIYAVTVGVVLKMKCGINPGRRLVWSALLSSLSVSVLSAVLVWLM